jgi:hypothetical protein
MTISRLIFIALPGIAFCGGGFWMEFGNPTASKDPKAKNAAILVRAVGCGNPAQAVVSGTAEGIVNGQRKSVPLKFIELSAPGVWALERNWPQEGAWVLDIRTTYNMMLSAALAKVDRSGAVQRTIAPRRDPPKDSDIAKALAEIR